MHLLSIIFQSSGKSNTQLTYVLLSDIMQMISLHCNMLQYKLSRRWALCLWGWVAYAAADSVYDICGTGLFPQMFLFN